MHLGSLKSWLVKGLKDKWRVTFLVFAAAYALVLIFGVFDVFGLSFMSIQWDEIPHLNGGALLLRGDTQMYFQNNAFYPPMFS